MYNARQEDEISNMSHKKCDKTSLQLFRCDCSSNLSLKLQQSTSSPLCFVLKLCSPLLWFAPKIHRRSRVCTQCLHSHSSWNHSVWPIKPGAAQLKEHIPEEAVEFINYVEKTFIGSFHKANLHVSSGCHMRLLWKEAIKYNHVSVIWSV